VNAANEHESVPNGIETIRPRLYTVGRTSPHLTRPPSME